LIPHGEKLPRGLCIFDCPEYKNDNIKFIFLEIGALSMLTSIPFFLGLAKYKHKAEKKATINFQNQKILFLQPNSFTYKLQPSLTLKIGL
jgi:hypothetical protein